MITEPTVLILGAGASSDYGFPLGRGLRDRVCSDFDPTLEASIEEAGFDIDLVNEFKNSLRHSGYSSVDWFLEDRPEFIDVGKAAIAAALIPFERPDRLFPPGAPQNHWYELLVNTLDNPLGAFAQNRLSIVTFNYDRSLEYYLFRVLENRLGSESQAIGALNSMEIIHVHGALGGLTPLSEAGRPYSPIVQARDVRVAANEIVILGEATDEAEPFRRARAALHDARRIVFLGFSFHPQSVRRLEVFNEPWDEERRRTVRVGGTTRGIPTHSWNEIRDNVLNGAYPGDNRRIEPVYRYLSEAEPLAA